MRTLFSAVLTIAVLAMIAAPASAQETTPNDVTVTFTVCLEGTGEGTSNGAVCVTGGAEVLGDWGNSQTTTPPDLTNSEGSLWTVDVTFPTGTPTTVEYKYKKDGCSDWEQSGNRTLTLPTDGSTTMVQDPDSFNQVTPIGCGLAATLSTEKTVCFQVCLDGVDHTGGSCVIGNIALLGGFTNGLPLVEIGQNLYQHCVTFPAGTTLPIEYKFQVDDCTTWESLTDDPFANRVLDLTDASPAMQTVTSVWNNGDGNCSVVSDEVSTWGTVKARYEQ